MSPLAGMYSGPIINVSKAYGALLKSLENKPYSVVVTAWAGKLECLSLDLIAVTLGKSLNLCHSFFHLS